MEAVQRKDMSTAADLCDALESLWDRAEVDLQRKDMSAFQQIDHAMDNFIRPIMRYQSVPTDLPELKRVYGEYLKKLELGK